MHSWIYCSLGLVLLLGNVHTAETNKKLPPMILIPGLIGSQMLAKIDKPMTRNSLCRAKSSDYFFLWLSPESLVYPYVICFVDNIRLVYNSVSGKTSNSPGVDIQIPGFGNTSSVEYLSNLQIPQTAYYHALVKKLVTQLGYTRGMNIHGAPYDFRKAPSELDDYFKSLKKLIEDTYALNGKTRVNLLGHSMGSLLAHHFLLSQTPFWKNRYIDTYFSVVAPLGGSAQALRAQISGDRINNPLIVPHLVREAQRSWPSLLYLLPQPTAWNRTDIVAKTSQRNYTVNDYKDLFNDMDHSLGFRMLLTVQAIRDKTAAPGVKTVCILSRGVPTPLVLDWTKKSFPNDEPNVEYGDGDGSVNWASQEICTKWQTKQSQPLFSKVHMGADHVEILKSDEFVNHIASVVQESLDQ